MRSNYHQERLEDLTRRIKLCASAHHDLAVTYEVGGNTQCAKELRAVENLLESILQGTETTIYPGREFELVSVGARLKMRGDSSNTIYVLCCVGAAEICAINLQSGMRWTDSVAVNNINKISSEELQKILSGDLVRWTIVLEDET